MPISPFLLLAQTDDITPVVQTMLDTGILVPITLFIMLGVVGVAAFYFRYRQRKDYYDTIRAALEKGVRLPEGFSDPGKVDTGLGFTTGKDLEKDYYETVRAAIDKGVPLPPNFPAPESVTPTRASPGNDLRKGIMWLAVGVGLYLWLADIHSGDFPASIGAIPICIGLARILYWYLFGKSQVNPPSASRPNPPASTPPPRL